MVWVSTPIPVPRILGKGLAVYSAPQDDGSLPGLVFFLCAERPVEERNIPEADPSCSALC